MNYTETYNKIYSAISKSNMPHEHLHNAALRITDALNNIYCYTNAQFPDMMEDVIDVVIDFSTQLKFGGYDLDDNGNPVGGYKKHPIGL